MTKETKLKTIKTPLQNKQMKLQRVDRSLLLYNLLSKNLEFNRVYFLNNTKIFKRFTLIYKDLVALSIIRLNGRSQKGNRNKDYERFILFFEFENGEIKTLRLNNEFISKVAA